MVTRSAAQGVSVTGLVTTYGGANPLPVWQSLPRPARKQNMAKNTNRRRPTILRTRSRGAPQLECKPLVDKKAQ